MSKKVKAGGKHIADSYDIIIVGASSSGAYFPAEESGHGDLQALQQRRVLRAVSGHHGVHIREGLHSVPVHPGGLRADADARRPRAVTSFGAAWPISSGRALDRWRICMNEDTFIVNQN